MKTINQIFMEYVNENYWNLIEFLNQADEEEIKTVSNMLIDYSSKEMYNYLNHLIKNWEIKNREWLENRVYLFIQNIECRDIGMWEYSDLSEIVDDYIRYSDFFEVDEDDKIILK